MSGAVAVPERSFSQRERWQRWRWPLAAGLVLLLSGLVTAATVAGAGDGRRLGPDNPAPEGAKALVEILRQRGVDVRPVRRSDELVRSTDTHWAVLVTSPGLLNDTQLDRLATDDLAHLVLVEPDEVTLARLAPEVGSAGTVSAAVRDPACAVGAATAAGPARAGGHLYRWTGDTGIGDAGSGSPVCYPEPGETDTGSYLSVLSQNRTVTVIGQSELLTNEHLAQEGNAALALRTLGRAPVVAWYLPDPLEAIDGEAPPSLTDLLPDWVFWVALQLLLVTVVAIVWRARRLGALVPEPLPVVVRAAETQEGRARLYRHSRARGRAAATLRTTSLRRLAARLSTPLGTGPDQLITLLAEATGRDPAGLGRLLLGPAPESDAALVALADDLDTLERELSRHDPKGPQ